MKKSSNANKKAESTDNQQKTLFQCWKSSSKLTNENTTAASSSAAKSVSTSNLLGTKPSVGGVLGNSSNFFQNVSTFPKHKAATSSYFKGGNQGKRASDDDIQIIDDDQDMLDSLMNEEANRPKASGFKSDVAASFAKPVNVDEDDDDLQMILASESILKEKSFQSSANRTTLANSTTFAGNDQTHGKFNAEDEDNDSEKLTVGLDDDALQSTQFFDTSGFDSRAGAVWIFPSNMPTRSYQYNIIEQCLYKNTMVVLPTGLGKTFVAAVVMLNFYRW